MDKTWCLYNRVMSQLSVVKQMKSLLTKKIPLQTRSELIPSSQQDDPEKENIPGSMKKAETAL